MKPKQGEIWKYYEPEDPSWEPEHYLMLDEPDQKEGAISITYKAIYLESGNTTPVYFTNSRYWSRVA
jgi:hypothetical protein